MADPDGSVMHSITAVSETKEGLFLGSLQSNGIGFLKRSDFAPEKLSEDS